MLRGRKVNDCKIGVRSDTLLKHKLAGDHDL